MVLMGGCVDKMKDKLFNIVFAMILVIWVGITILLPVKLGFIGLFVLGILILLVLFYWIVQSKKSEVEEPNSIVFENPSQFRDLSEELKELFEREKAKGKEVKDKKVVKNTKKVSKVKPKYVASTEGGSYHKDTCRFSKSIKGKYRLEENSKAFFINKKYPACKMCKPSKS